MRMYMNKKKQCKRSHEKFQNNKFVDKNVLTIGMHEFDTFFSYLLLKSF